MDRKTGQRQLLKEISPGDQAGLSAGALRITPDGKSYAYTADQGLSVLQLARGSQIKRLAGYVRMRRTRSAFSFT